MRLEAGILIILAAIFVWPGVSLADDSDLSAGVDTLLIEFRQKGCERYGGNFLAAGFSIDLTNALADSRSITARQDESLLVARRDNEVKMTAVLGCSSGGTASLIAEFERNAGDDVFERISIGGNVDDLLTLRLRLLDAVHRLLGSREAGQANRNLDLPEYRDYLLAIGGAVDGELSRKIRMLETAAQASNAFSPVWAHLGAALLKMGEREYRNARSHFSQAERALGRALDINPHCPFAIDALAAVYMRTGRTEEAAHMVQSAVFARPRSAMLRSRLAYAYRYAGLLDQSVEEYRRSETLDPSLANVISIEGQIAKAHIYKGDYKAALTSYGRIHQLLLENGQDPDEKTLFYEGLTYLYKRDSAKAVQLFEAAYATRPDSVWSRFATAYKYAAIGDHDSLRSMAKKLENDNIADGERRYRLAHFYAAAGEIDAAASHLAAALDAGNFNFPYISRDPFIEPIRATEQYAKSIQTMKSRYSAFQDSLIQN